MTTIQILALAGIGSALALALGAYLYTWADAKPWRA